MSGASTRNAPACSSSKSPDESTAKRRTSTRPSRASGPPVFKAAAKSEQADYDEIAHYSGPERAESLDALDGVDRALATLERARLEAPRPTPKPRMSCR